MFMWETSVNVYDGFKKELFTLRTMLFGTINDFSANGKCACPICEGNTNWTHLEYCLKNVFLGYRRFLNMKHRYRK